VTDKALSFFRLFDLAFFVPGAVVFAAFVYGYVCSASSDVFSFDLTELFGIGAILGSLGAIYLIGMFLHGLQRLLYGRKSIGRLFAGARASAGANPWYWHLERGRREELVLYFWYLRATCWNTALAVLAAPVAVALGAGSLHAVPFWLLPAVLTACLLLLYMGWDFERALRAFEQASDERQEHNAAQLNQEQRKTDVSS